MSEAMLQKIKEGIDDFIIETREYAGELTIEVKPENIHEVCLVLKTKMGFNYLSDISSVDYYSDEKRFGVAYNLINLAERKRLRLLTRVEEEDPTVDTVCDVWRAATWYEREAFDMMGIKFRGHPDLRRLFMPEDFEYYPMRKEFPLLGIPGSIQMPEPAPPKEYK